MTEKIIEVNENELTPATELDILQKASEPIKLTEDELQVNEAIFDGELNEKSIIESAKKAIGMDNISDAEMLDFMELIKRIKNKEHITNLFAQLPKSFKIGIDKAMKEMNNTDIQFYNLMAKELIENIVGDSSFNAIVEEYNTEVKKVNTDLKEGRTLLSATQDVFRETVRVKYQEIVDKARADGKEEVAKYYEKIIDIYNKVYDLTEIKEMIESKESFVNRCYKEGRHFNTYCMKFDEKFCMAPSTITNKNGDQFTKPNIRTLEMAYKALRNKGYDDDVAKAFCIMVYFNTADKSLYDVHESTYVYILIDAIFMLDKASDLGDATSEFIHNLNIITNKISTLIISKSTKNKKSKKK